MSEQHHAPPGPAHGHKGTITIPGIGKLPTWAVVGGIGLVGVLIIMHNRKAASSSTGAAAAGTETDSAGNVGTIDPATGFVYGSAEDTAALGGTAAAGGDAISGGGASVGDQVTSGPPFTSNAAWSQYAVSILETSGYDPGTVTGELGLYLAGSPVTAAQRDDINAAIAVAGLPPVAGTNGMPPSINVTGSVAGGGPSGGPTGGGPASGSPTPPASGGPITVTPVNLQEVKARTSKNSLQVSWVSPTIPSGQGPLTGFGVACYEAASGHLVNGPFTVSKNQLYANVGGLKSKTKYNVNVWCDPAKTGGPHANVAITTN